MYAGWFVSLLFEDIHIGRLGTVILVDWLVHVLCNALSFFDVLCLVCCVFGRWLVTFCITMLL